MEFGKQHDTTDTTDFCPRQLVTDLSFMLQTCYGETGVMDFGIDPCTPDDKINKNNKNWILSFLHCDSSAYKTMNGRPVVSAMSTFFT